MSSDPTAADKTGSSFQSEADTAEAIAKRAARFISDGFDAAAMHECERLIEARDLDLPSLDLGIWAAITLQRSDLAGKLVEIAARHAPNDVLRQKAAVSVLANSRQFEAAIPYARAARDLVPDDADCAYLLGAILNEAGLHEEAIETLLQAVRIRPSFAEAFHHLAYASLKLGADRLAAILAVRALALEPSNASRAMFAAHLLRQINQLDDAIEILYVPQAQGECGAQLRRTLSDCLYEAGKLEEALDELDAALELCPDHAEYLLHRCTLLSLLGKHDEVVSGVDAAIEKDPENLHFRRHAVSLYLESGALERAIATTAELLRRVPTNDEYASCMLHVLSLKAQSPIDMPDLALLKRQERPQIRRRTPNLIDGLKTQARVIPALLLREMRTRFGESRLGYLWVLMEMIIHLGVLAIVFQFTMHGKPPLGHSFFLFYFTGLTPYLLFIHTSEQCGHGIIQNRYMLQLPMVTNFDVILARGLLELFTQFVVSCLFIAGFLIAGVDAALPINLAQALNAFFIAWLLGLGWGFINAVLNVFLHIWQHVFSIVIRVLYFCSGIFYVPAAMPLAVRDILAWNPLLHCVDWFRTAFFVGYSPQWMDRGYAVLCSLCVLLLGLLLEGAFRIRLRKPI